MYVSVDSHNVWNLNSFVFGIFRLQFILIRHLSSAHESRSRSISFNLQVCSQPHKTLSFFFFSSFTLFSLSPRLPGSQILLVHNLTHFSMTLDTIHVCTIKQLLSLFTSFLNFSINLHLYYKLKYMIFIFFLFITYFPYFYKCF